MIYRCFYLIIPLGIQGVALLDVKPGGYDSVKGYKKFPDQSYEIPRVTEISAM